MAYNEIEKIFIDDIREKKRTGRGAFAKTGKGSERAGVKGGLKTPYSFMTTRERKKLNGEVRKFNMYETIIRKEEFFLKDVETQKAMLTRWREIYSNKKIMEEMGVKGNAGFHNIIKELGVPMKQNRIDKKGNRKASIKPSLLEQIEATQKELATVGQAPQPSNTTTPIVNNFVQQTPVKIITNGLHLEYNGKFSSEQINKIFTKLQLLVDGEENEFNIELRITECEKKENKIEGETS